jgi:hypothetical protein
VTAVSTKDVTRASRFIQKCIAKQQANINPQTDSPRRRENEQKSVKVKVPIVQVPGYSGKSFFFFYGFLLIMRYKQLSNQKQITA